MNTMMQQDLIKPLDILLVENDSLDQLAFRRFVRRQQLPYDYTIVSSPVEAKNAMQLKEFDVVLLDYQLDHGSAFDLIDEDSELKVPFVLMTGAGAEDVAVKALKLGAADYLIKDDHRDYLQRLPNAIENAIRSRDAADSLRRAQIDASAAGSH